MTTKKTTENPTMLLVDNGSTRVDAAVQLRAVAQKLSNKIGKKIHAVSLKHSNRIAEEDVIEKLAGIPAPIFSEFISEHLNQGTRDFILIPLFFGKSRALTSFVPDEKEALEAQFGKFQLRMTEVLYPLPKGDSQLVDILYEHAMTIATENNSQEASHNIVLVDHGTPLPAVNAVRQHIAASLKTKLPKAMTINQVAMERRPGKEYDFNGELLEDYLNRLAESGETHVIVLLLFLFSGTHAGENGDIVQICNRVMKDFPEFKVVISPLIGQNEKLLDCLSQRINQLKQD